MLQRSAVILALFALVAPGSARGQDGDPPTFSETITVDLLNVPFYAVDRAGKPVYDLKAEEVELLLDGKPVSIDAFDRYGAPEAARVGHEAGSREAGRLLGASTPRHVFLLFDLAFTNPRALEASRQLATNLLAKLPGQDWLYLLRYNTQTGFEQELGPLPADEGARAKLRERIAAYTPSIGRIRLQSDLQPIARGKREGGNVDAAYIDTHATEKANYRAEGMAFGAALDSFAVFLRQLKGPKLVLFFSQGFDNQVYNEGIEGRLRPMRSDFEPILRRLGETGAMVIFANATAHTEAGIDESFEFDHEADATQVNAIARGEAALFDMARVSGGKVIAHTNVQILEREILDWTAAYYELGHYAPAGEGVAQPAVELRVKRPGVEVWTPKWVRARRPFSQLARREKEFVLADLVLRGPNGEAAKGVASAAFYRLEGKLAPAAGATDKMAFELEWPKEVRMMAVELYSVLVRVGDTPAETKLLAVTGGTVSPQGDTARLEVSLPAEAGVLWGVVAVEPASGAMYLRRFSAPPQAVANQAPKAPQPNMSGR